MGKVNESGRAIALLPIGVFLVIFLGSGIVFGIFMQCLPSLRS